jgi:hypothetical protein
MELLHLARSYRKLDKVLDASNEISARLPEFYISKGQIIEGEMRELDEKIRQVEQECHHQNKNVIINNHTRPQVAKNINTSRQRQQLI